MQATLTLGSDRLLPGGGLGISDTSFPKKITTPIRDAHKITTPYLTAQWTTYKRLYRECTPASSSTHPIVTFVTCYFATINKIQKNRIILCIDIAVFIHNTMTFNMLEVSYPSHFYAMSISRDFCVWLHLKKNQ